MFHIHISPLGVNEGHSAPYKPQGSLMASKWATSGALQQAQLYFTENGTQRGKGQNHLFRGIFSIHIIRSPRKRVQKVADKEPNHTDTYHPNRIIVIMEMNEKVCMQENQIKKGSNIFRTVSVHIVLRPISSFTLFLISLTGRHPPCWQPSQW